MAFFPYQWILSIGTLRAIFRAIRGVTNWEKTAHIGQHRERMAA
jgi:hypothetical protein